MSDEAIDIDRAKKAIEFEKFQRGERCRAAMQKLLDEHECTFEASMVLKPNAHPHLVVTLMPKEKK